VNINAQFSHQALSRINPLFANLISIEGQVSATLEGIELPLGDGMKTGGKGSGHVDFSKLKIKPAGLLGVLQGLQGTPIGDLTSITITGVDFKIRNGGVEYDNFKVIFPGEFDVIFRGRVGFDDTMKMTISLPITSAMLDKFKVKGPLGDFARVLRGVRIDIPVAGTRTKSDLDLSKVDIRPVVEKAMKALVTEQPGKTLPNPFEALEPKSPKK
jgi:hypothetical protein